MDGLETPNFVWVGPYASDTLPGTNNIYVVYQGKSIGETTPGENSIEFGMIKSINGGYENKATVSSTITVDAADNMMLCGPVSLVLDIIFLRKVPFLRSLISLKYSMVLL